MAETVDAREPVIIERRIDDAVMARSMIEAMFVCDHAYVRQITKEYERAEFVLFARRWSTEATPQGSRTAALKINTSRLVNAPNKT